MIARNRNATALSQYTRDVTPELPKSLEGKLSPREAQIAVLVADGRSNKYIGTTLGISAGTVPGYMHRIMRKLELDTARDMRVEITRVVVLAWAKDEDGVQSLRDTQQGQARSA